MAQELFPIGNAEITAPTGWCEVSKETERMVLRSLDGHQQATISTLGFSADVSFDNFKRLCVHRLEAEKKGFVDGFVRPQAPFDASGVFGMLFSGGENQNRRVFSGYLSLAKKELITIYVEGVGIAPKEHLESFKAFVNGLSRK